MAFHMFPHPVLKRRLRWQKCMQRRNVCEVVFFCGGWMLHIENCKTLRDWLANLNDFFKLFPLRKPCSFWLVLASSQEVFAILYLSIPNFAPNKLPILKGTCSADFLGSSCYSMFNPLGYFYSILFQNILPLSNMCCLYMNITDMTCIPLHPTGMDLNWSYIILHTLCM